MAAREARSRRRAKSGRQAAATGDRRAPPSDQVNPTDEESRIMPVTCGRFEQFYNARAAVVTGSLMVGERRGPKICWRTLAISAPRM
jgi:hypothetical protein